MTDAKLELIESMRTRAVVDRLQKEVQKQRNKERWQAVAVVVVFIAVMSGFAYGVSTGAIAHSDYWLMAGQL